MALLLVLDVDSTSNYSRLNEALTQARSASQQPRRKLGLSPRLAYRSSAESSWSFSGQNTLGIVHYRRGEFEEALNPLLEFHEAGFLEPSNWLFLAMTHHQLGNVDQAGRWYEKAEAYFEDNQPTRMEAMFRAEAKELFGEVAQ